MKYGALGLDQYAMDYYDQKQLLAKVDENDTIIGQIEKWEAHKKGILHRAFTVAIKCQGGYVLQHRKHPAFNGVFDLTTSSHQKYIEDTLQTDEEAIYDAILREWGLSPRGLNNLTFDGKIIYEAKDPYSEFQEHEVCSIYSIELPSMPVPNLEYAYGYAIVSKEEVTNKQSRIYENLAPWVKKMIEEKLLS